MNQLGECGKDGFCEAAQIACFTCANFRPELNGPHEAMLQQLISERESPVEKGDERTASVRDRTISAVAEIVRLGEQRGWRHG